MTAAGAKPTPTWRLPPLSPGARALVDRARERVEAQRYGCPITGRQSGQ